MASSKPQCSAAVSSSSEEECEVQVLDSSEPLVTDPPVSSRAQALDSSEPLLLSVPSISRVQVLDSGEPLVPSVVVVPSTSGVQVIDSVEPLVLPDPCSSGMGAPTRSPDSSGRADSSSSDDEVSVLQTGSSGRRIHYTADELRASWSWGRFYRCLGTEEQCIQFAEEKGLIPVSMECRYHKRPMTFTSGVGAGQLGKFRCRKVPCRTRNRSRAEGTWFERARVPITVIFQIMYGFSEEASYHQVQREVATNSDFNVSSATIADWYNYCRETIVVYELEHHEVEGKIGGPGKVVQIDESKFGRRKYNRGRHIEGHWVIGMIEDKCDDLRLEVCPNNERTSEVLIPLIQKHVEVGSIIHTDFWRAYLALPEHGYTHKRVNHSDPENRFVGADGVHTQRIESQWRGLKKEFRHKQNKKDFADWLIIYRWRRKIKFRHGHPFDELLKAIKYVYPAPD